MLIFISEIPYLDHELIDASPIPGFLRESILMGLQSRGRSYSSFQIFDLLSRDCKFL